jgi:hypothetical protein
MMNPTQLWRTVKAMDYGGDALRGLRATGAGKFFSGLGRPLAESEQAAVAAHSSEGIRSIVDPMRAAGVRIGTTGADLAARGGVAAREAAIWSNTVGRSHVTNAWAAFKSNPRQQVMAAGLGAAALGGMTASPDATPGQKLGRMVGFGLLGAHGARVGMGNRDMFAGAFTDMMAGNWRAGGRGLARALEMPERWGMKQSIMAGGFYGMISNNTSIAEGAIFGGVAHLGVRGIGRNATRRDGIQIRKAFRDGGYGAAFQRMPLGMLGMYGGAMRGAYNAMGQDDWSGMSVAGGAIKGGLIGGVLGGGAKLTAAHPWMVLGTVGPTLGLAGSAIGAAGTVASAGAPGFDTLNADGDLALSLHRLRHG